MDESERYTLEVFDTCEAATGACKRIVDEFLLERYSFGIEAETLWKSYVNMGEDPFISTTDKECRFSAWTYAKEQCAAMCGGSSEI